MNTPTDQVSCIQDDRLTRLPLELLTNILCFLPSLADVVSVAATSICLHATCDASAARIYKHVAEKSVSYLRFARKLLADQSGPAQDAAMTSWKDLSSVFNASCEVDRAVLKMEQDIKVKPKEYVFDAHYGMEHKPNMTPSERLRFIRSYYTLWGLMEMQPADWFFHINPLTLKQLWRLSDLSRWTHRIGKEGSTCHPSYRISSRYNRSKKRIALDHAITVKAEEIFGRYVGLYPRVSSGWHGRHTRVCLFTVWDVCRQEFEAWVYDGNGNRQRYSLSAQKEDFWDESSDEEGEQQ